MPSKVCSVVPWNSEAMYHNLGLQLTTRVWVPSSPVNAPSSEPPNPGYRTSWSGCEATRPPGRVSLQNQDRPCLFKSLEIAASIADHHHGDRTDLNALKARCSKHLGRRYKISLLFMPISFRWNIFNRYGLVPNMPQAIVTWTNFHDAIYATVS